MSGDGTDLVTLADRAPNDRAVVVTAAMMREAIAAHLTGDGWHVAYEVGDAAGLAAKRWADAIAINLWPSRGHVIQGYEIKVSRADWQKELATAAKAEAFHRYCNTWWIAAKAGVVIDGELPPGWGLLEYQTAGRRAGKFVVVRPATHTDRPEGPPMSFMAAYLKAVQRAHDARVEKGYRDQLEKAMADARARWEDERSTRFREGKAKWARVDAALVKLGVGDWNADDENLAMAVAWLIKHDVFGRYNHIATVLREVREAESAIKSLKDKLTGVLSDANLMPPPPNNPRFL